jgi:hypothetical protein
MAIQVRVFDTCRVPDPIGTGMIFYSRVTSISEPRQVWDEYFFLPVDNLMGTCYFTTAIILDCEQVKMCSFCYINYNLF